VRNTMPSKFPETNWNDPLMYVNLFVFDGSSKLTFKASSSPIHELRADFPCGKGIVGNAFRRRTPWGFSRLHARPHLAHNEFALMLPPNVSTLFAFPLYIGPPVGNWPLGVIALISPSEASGLHSLVDPAQILSSQDLWLEAEKLWRIWRDKY
jgi:hypothetical protein